MKPTLPSAEGTPNTAEVEAEAVTPCSPLCALIFSAASAADEPVDIFTLVATSFVVKVISPKLTNEVLPATTPPKPVLASPVNAA